MLILRPPELRDEATCLAAQREFETFGFLLQWQPAMEWPSYLALLEGLRSRTLVPEGLVPSAFLLAEVDGQLVGRVSVRFSLNDYLAAVGGHIGYGVRPAFRRRGHATEILRRAVAIAHDGGVEHPLVVCDEDNIASARVIERCGGILESVVTPEEGAPPLRRYWID